MNGQFLFQVFEVLPEVLVGFAEVVDRSACVEHGGVILASTVQSDVGQGRFGHLLGEVHGDLTGLNDFALPGFALEKFDGQVEVVAHHFLDVVNADLSCGVFDKLVDHMLGQVQCDGFAVQACLSDQGNQCSFQFTHVGGDAVSQVFNDFSGQFNAVGVHLLLQDGHARFKRWHLEVRTQTPLEAREQALFHALHFDRRLVRSQDNLLASLVQVIEDVEEDVLCFLLATEKLHIVDDEHIHHLIEVAEIIDRVVPNSINELMRESLGADIEHRFVRLATFDFQPNGMRQVCFSQTHPSVNKKRIERRPSRFVGHGKTGASCKAVALSFNEVFEGVVGIEV